MQPVTLQRHVKRILVGYLLRLKACFVVGMWWRNGLKDFERPYPFDFAQDWRETLRYEAGNI
jgi:hypothetical protein